MFSLELFLKYAKKIVNPPYIVDFEFTGIK